MIRKHRTSVAYLTVVGAEPVEQIEAAAAAGFDSVGLRTVAPLGLALQYPIVGNAAMLRSIRAACARTGVSILDGEVLTLTAETDVARFAPAIETVAELGARYMQITSEDPDDARAVENFAACCEIAGALNVAMAFEFMRWRTVRTIEEAYDFVARAGKANGGIVLDTLHLSRSGGTPSAVAALPPGQVFYVQLCDARATMPLTTDAIVAEARGGRLYPGDGDLWLDALFDLLPDDIAISIEVPGAMRPDASVAERTQGAARALDRFLTRRGRARTSAT
jgi:sugar phosphate isomerase/epimerase